MSRKRKTENSQALLKNFAQKVAAKSDGAKLQLNPQGEISMSDAISQLIQPYRDDAPSYGTFCNLVTFACIAWNASILPAEEQSGLIDTVLASTRNVEDRLDTFGFLTELMDRKKRLFPDISRLIVDFKVTDQGNGFYIAVASASEKKE